MSSITQEQRQYLTYILADQDARVEIVPERGGIVTSWQVGDREIFYLDTERFTHPELTVRGGIPILFPICGNLPDNTYTHQGKSYSLSQHGFARNLPWQVTGEDAQGSPSLTLTLVSDDQTRAAYPFDFRVDFTYTVEGNRLKIRQRYTNQSGEAMPFSAGFHPYFAVADKSKLSFDIPGESFWDHRSQTTQSFPGNFDFDQEEIDVAFRQLPKNSAAVVDSGSGLKLTLEYSPEFSTLVFWTVKGKDFYCLEPWTGPRKALVTGENLITLEPGASLEVDFDLAIEVL